MKAKDALITEIGKAGLPVAAVWPDADSFGGVYVYPGGRTIFLGDAEIHVGNSGDFEKDYVLECKLTDLDLTTLAQLVENGIRPGDPDWPDMLGYCKESEKDIRAYKRKKGLK